jgi:hypothetical protein
VRARASLTFACIPMAFLHVCTQPRKGTDEHLQAKVAVFVKVALSTAALLP